MLQPSLIARVRREIPVTARAKYTYLNVGTMGPSPVPVHRAFLDAYQAWQDAGPGNPEAYHAAHALMEPARHALAAYLGVTADEVALTSNSTDGVNIVMAGLDWKKGDEVLTTDQEHPAVSVPWLNVQRRYGVVGRIFRLGATVDEILTNFRAQLSGRTKLVVISHVSSQTGIRLPVAEISALAHQAGALVCIDGAQACGQFPVNVEAVGCDFYTMNGHKWLLAPGGTGGVVLRRQAMERLTPVVVGAGSNEPVNYLEERRLQFVPSARRFENATRNWALYAGLTAAFQYMGAVGFANIEERGLGMSRRLRAGLAEIPGVSVKTPADHALSTGLVSWGISGWSGQDQYDALLNRFKVCGRPVGELDAVRASCAFFNLEEEVDLLLRAVAALAKERL